MVVINKEPVDTETLFYCLTGQYNFCVNKEDQLKDELKKKGIVIDLLTKEQAKPDANGNYLDILLHDYVKIDNYHRYLKVKPEDIPNINKRIKEASE